MNAQRLLLVCTLGLMLWNSCSSLKDDELPLETSNESDVYQEEERIVGGERAPPGKFPFAAALYYNGGFICTASIISKIALLTAAHCIISNNQQLPAYSFYAIVGNVNRSASNTKVTFSRVIPHPDYNPKRLLNDVAVLITSSPIKFSNDVRNICIDNSRKCPDFYAFKEAISIGWGYTSKVRETLPDILQYVYLHIITKVNCWLQYKGLTTDQNICASGSGKSKGICQGDSGGPLVYTPRVSTPVQIGVASFINHFIGCGPRFLGPSVFSCVSSFSDWIQEVTDDNDICLTRNT